MASESTMSAHGPLQHRAKTLIVADYLFLGAAFASFLLSVSLWFGGNKDQGVFVGLWVPSIISLGVYFRVILGRATL